ncbi:MAG: hypothetical protein ABFQ95_07945 [Pseudomonadota bacterium]
MAEFNNEAKGEVSMFVGYFRCLTARVVIVSYLWSQVLGGFACQATDQTTEQQANLEYSSAGASYGLSSSCSSTEENSYSPITMVGYSSEPVLWWSSDTDSYTYSSSSDSSSDTDDRIPESRYHYSEQLNHILHNLSHWPGDWQGTVEQKQTDQTWSQRKLLIQRHQIRFWQDQPPQNDAKESLAPLVLSSVQKLDITDNQVTLTTGETSHVFRAPVDSQTCISTLQQFFAHQKQWEALHHLGTSFVDRAVTCGRMIIEEYDVPNRLKTIPAANVGGIAGGDKFIVHGILFKFAKDQEIKDEVWLYGGKSQKDHLAFKNAGQELLGAQYVTSYGGLFETPLMAVIDYRGYRLMATSLIPITSTSLVYGSADAGKTVHDANLQVRQAMDQMGSAFNLQPHPVKNINMALCCDVEVHECELNQDQISYYCLDLARVFPPETMQSLDTAQSVFYQKLRPEFVRNYSQPLNADGFTDWVGDAQAQQDNQALLQATLYLRKKTIPTTVTQLLTPEVMKLLRQSMSKQAATHSQELRPLPLVTSLHQQGLNVRHLGLIWQYLQVLPRLADLSDPQDRQDWKFLQQHVANVMVLRVLKDYARQCLRAESQSGDDGKETLLEIMNDITCKSPQTRGFWQQQVPQLLRNKFQIDIADLCTFLHQGYLLSNFCRSMGVLLNHHVFARFCHYYDKSIAFEYGLSDIVDIRPTIKYLNIIDLASGIYHTMKARKARNPHSRVALEYWQRAQEKLALCALTWPFTNSALLPQALAELLKGLKTSINQIKQAQAANPSANLRMSRALAAYSKTPPHSPRQQPKADLDSNQPAPTASGTLPDNSDCISSNPNNTWWQSFAANQAGLPGVAAANSEIVKRLLQSTEAEIDVVVQGIYQLQHTPLQSQRDRLRVARLILRLQPVEVLLKDQMIDALIRDLKQVQLGNAAANKILQRLRQYYKGQAHAYKQASPAQRENLLLPRVTLRLFDQPTGYRCQQDKAYALMGINAYGEKASMLQQEMLVPFGLSSQPTAANFITDNAVGLWQKLLFGRGSAPATLLVFDDVDIWQPQEDSLLDKKVLKSLSRGKLATILKHHPEQQAGFTVKKTHHVLL